MPHTVLALTLYPRVFRFALHLTRDWCDAQDVTQSAYLRALPHVGAVTGDDLHLATLRYLRETAKTTWLDECRKRARRVQPVLVSDYAWASLPGPDEIDRLETSLAIWQVLDSMPADERAAVLARYAGETPRRYGERLGIGKDRAYRLMYTGRLRFQIAFLEVA